MHGITINMDSAAQGTNVWRICDATHDKHEELWQIKDYSAKAEWEEMLDLRRQGPGIDRT